MKLLKQLWHGLYIRLLTKISPIVKSNAVNGKLQSEGETTAFARPLDCDWLQSKCCRNKMLNAFRIERYFVANKKQAAFILIRESVFTFSLLYY